ncbi:hypothetical protein [Vibrio phage vB_VruC_PG21]|uniref:Uncharacterized protein n=1 Tax=Vibrio phage vB_VruC_PG21 TaxID=2928757 RepID=A0AAE9KG85_9VIRU|nr:hypothetical protein [Vibrio sp. CK2-1]MCF7355070.1 hypothetical protein [Vibrio sp. CK2-1]UOL48292.1 hypothetical protein [Vibrio phage vB_VruC_PG21]
MSDREPVGFLPCKKCLSLKSVYQGQGKRARFLYAKCKCGLDQRTGAPVQNAFAKHITKEEAQAQLETLKTPTETKEQKEESSSTVPWVIAGLIGVFGFLKLRG